MDEMDKEIELKIIKLLLWISNGNFIEMENGNQFEICNGGDRVQDWRKLAKTQTNCLSKW